MSPYDCCCLGHLVLPRFVKEGQFKDPSDKFDWDAFRTTIKTGVRFLDDVLSVNSYPLPEIESKCRQLRRIGLGVLGLHHMLIELGLQYNSADGLEFVDKLFKFLKNESYEASIDLAIEKGPFPGFDTEKYLKSAFVKTLKPSIRERIRKHGIRNCALNTIAPTGTISMVCEVSSGIEPIFAMAYERRYRKGEEKAVEIVADPLFKRYVAEGRNTKNFQNSYDLSIRDHLEMQRTCQKHIDNAVSKTINLPPGTSEEELSELYMEFLPELKGVTVYPVGSREDQPLTPLPQERAEELVFEAILQAGGNDACKTGACDM
jgi:ribonucleoside-diphosphate reductase alpha chain